MKKIITMAFMLLLAVGAFAQEGKKLYNKYSDQEGVSAVYISPAMFKLVGQLPDINVDMANGEKMDVAPLVRSFSGFYMLSFEQKSPASTELYKEVTAMVNKGNFELLMEVKDSGSTIRMYTLGDEKTVSSFVCIINEDDETMFFSLEGSMDRSDLEKLIAGM
ncbi:MAG: DUF4252 domain-containing protein [Bacteroidales bacterium]|nr:DUF4252 domain-containing protein [Bacteroidales bacterium]